MQSIVFIRALTSDSACRALEKVGFRFTPEQVRVEERDERSVVHLPGRRLAWFASSDQGLRRLQTERRVLHLLESRCSFGAPRVIFESATGDFDVRTMVPGTADPQKVYAAFHRASKNSLVGSVLMRSKVQLLIPDRVG